MSVIPIGHGEAVIELGLRGEAGPALNIFGFAYDVNTDAQTVADDIATVVGTDPGYRGLLSVEVDINSVLVRCRADAGEPLIAESTVGLAGTVTGGSPPPQVALLIQKITGRAGRVNRGRMYLPAPGESLVDETGKYASGQVAAFQTDANAFLSGLDTAGYPMAILHTDPAISPTDVVSLRVDNLVATQRRRLR